MQRTIERALPSDASAAGLARNAVGEVGGLGDELRGDLRLLVTELVTNSIRHAGLDAEPVVLRIRAGPTVRVEVWDGGAGFTPTAPPHAPEASSGWGLFLVDRLSTRWGIERTSRTCVWAEIDVRPTEAPEDDGSDVVAVGRLHKRATGTSTKRLHPREWRWKHDDGSRLNDATADVRDAGDADSRGR